MTFDGKERDELLLEAVEIVSEKVSRAYWNNGTNGFHCGTDFSESGCAECNHFPVCHADYRLAHIAKEIRSRLKRDVAHLDISGREFVG